jgi:hypothetical protein
MHSSVSVEMRAIGKGYGADFPVVSMADVVSRDRERATRWSIDTPKQAHGLPGYCGSVLFESS